LEYETAKEPDKLSKGHKEPQYHRALLRKELCAAERALHDFGGKEPSYTIGLLCGVPFSPVLHPFPPSPLLVDH